MSLHILPVPSWCVETQSFDAHEAYAKAHGLCSRPGTGCKGYYYGGIDLAPPWSRQGEDIPITASRGGEVTILDQSPAGYGLHVRVLADDGELTIYAHLSRTTVINRQRVRQGERLGWMGNTGNSTGKHVHWEIRNAQGIPVDPRTRMTVPGPPSPPEPPLPFPSPAAPEIGGPVVITPGWNIRAGPSLDAAILSMSTHNIPGKLLERSGEWRKVSLEVWVYQDALD